MATLAIAIEEYTNATKFKLSDNTDWVGFSDADITSVDLTVTYDSTDYTLELYDSVGGINLISLGATSVNLFGDSINSYYDVNPEDLLDGTGASLDADYFPDGYYTIKLDVEHDTEGSMTDTETEGFLAEAYCKAAQLPFELDVDDLDYHESRLQFLIIAMLDAAVRAAELSRYTDFEEIVETINGFYSARSLTDLW
jgi:hypothetical protein